MSDRLRVLITDHPWPGLEPEREELDGVGAELVFASHPDEPELISLARDADAILTCFAAVTPAVIDAAPRLQVIGRYGIGVDNIAVAHASARGILVTNTPTYCTDEVADHTLALLLSLNRCIPFYDRAVRHGDRSLYSAQPIQRLRGQTLGILGLGQIGTAVAIRAQALGLEVIAHHPRRHPEQLFAVGIRPAALRELASTSDYISLHVPLREDTEGLIDEAFLRLMKPTAYLINTARGGLIDHSALVRALAQQRIAGAALDVTFPEPIPSGDPLLGLPNVILTPHVAYYSEQSLRSLGRLAAQNVASVLSGRRPAAIVNPEVLELVRWNHLLEPPRHT